MKNLRIRNWDANFENASSRKLKRLDWVGIPNRMDGPGYTSLVDHPNGAAHLGAWLAIVEIASRQGKSSAERGVIPQGVGGICQTLGRISRLPSGIFEEVIPRLMEIGWIEPDQLLTSNPPLSAGALGESADTSAKSGSTGKGMEGNGSEGDGKERKPLEFPRTDPSWKGDASYIPFVEAWWRVARTTGKPIIEDDFADAHFRWSRFDFEQKLLAVRTTNEHLDLGVWTGATDPQYVPLPKKYLELEYKRPVVGPKPRESPGLKPTALEIALQRAKEKENAESSVRS